jgi:CubicO group peptidase (beta-lactamase class C family)
MDTAGPAFPPDFRSELRSVVEEAMARLHVPGVAVGILDLSQGEDDAELYETFGVTNVEHPLPVTASTLFQIGSTTKTFTATLLMQDVDEGRLDLDAPVYLYLHEFWLSNDDWAPEVRVRDLLTHTGGFDGDWFLMHPLGEGQRLARVVGWMAQVPSYTPPGEFFSYSNAGFAIAGRLVEVFAGISSSYEGLVMERLFEPLGMRNSVAQPIQLLGHRYAVGHNVSETASGEARVEVARPVHLERGAAAHGGIISDAQDQIRWARFHLGDGTALDGTRVLSEQALRRMQERRVEAGSICDAVGYSWLIEDYEDGAGGSVQTLRHGGETHGQMSAFRIVPERDFAITVLTNASSGAQLHEEVVAWVLERCLGLRWPDPPLVAMDELGSFEGRFGGTLKDVTLRVHDGVLHAEVTRHRRPLRPQPPPLPPIPLGFIDERTVIALDGPQRGMRGDLLHDIEGAHSWLRWDGRLMPRVE